ncbi:MAG: 2,3,4,5-tetrahydropyridine-2,6-dicarboxylate N-succinyltransferase [Gammaproteobacteria bacterium]
MSISLIENAFENIQSISAAHAPADLVRFIEETISALNHGEIRVAEKKEGTWVINEWIKKAILLYFRTQDNTEIEGSYTRFYDKIPLKHTTFTRTDFVQSGVRVVPGAVVRTGCYIGPNTVVMPSFINIGAYIGSGCMIDTWATVGSCVQMGKNVHLSGGAGLGGVLEPLQASPTIIEDDVFVGARSEIVEGVRIGAGSVISMGVFIGASTKIYDRTTGEVSFGYVPEGSVVVPGSLPSSDGRCHLACAVIVKKVDLQTRQKVGLNAILRDIP